MNTESILNIFNTMVNQNIIYTFHGEFKYDMVDTLLNDVKKELQKSDTERLTQKKTYNVLVECLENVHRHTTERSNDIGKHEGIFVLIRKEHGYGVVVGNIITKEEVAGLKQKIEEVNSLSRDELKALYKSSIRSATISDKGGAGLGIIDIALKSGGKLGYSFHDHHNGHIFFTLEIEIKE